MGVKKWFGLVCCVLVLTPTRSKGQEVNWTFNGSGFWDEAARWEFGALPGPTDRVWIGYAPYSFPGIQVTHRTGTTSITALNSKGALILSGGTLNLTNSGGLSLIEGPFTISGAALSNAGTMQIMTQPTWSSGSLGGSGRYEFHAGMSYTSSANRSILGTATVSNYGVATWSSATGNLTLASGATYENRAGATTVAGSRLVTGGTFVNDGTVVSNSARFLCDQFINRGTVNASSFSTTISNLRNTGMINLSPGSDLYLDGSYTTSEIGTLNLANGTRAVFSGAINNTGQAFDPNRYNSNALRILDGVLTGGEITNSENLMFGGGAVLDGVTVRGGLTIGYAPSFASQVTIRGNTTWNGPINIIDGKDLVFEGGYVLQDKYILARTTSTTGFADIYPTMNGRLELGSGSEIRATRLSLGLGGVGTSFVNRGLVIADDSIGGISLVFPSADNYGTMSATNGAFFTVSRPGFRNFGTVEASNGGLVTIYPGMTQQGTLRAIGNGRISIRQHVGTLASLGTLSASSGGRIVLEGGQFSNTNLSYDFSTIGPSKSLILDARITGGTLLNSHLLGFNQGFLENVNAASGLDVDGIVTLVGSIGLGGPVNIHNGDLRFANSFTFSNRQFNLSESTGMGINAPNGGTVTFDTTTRVQGTGNANLGFAVSGNMSAINRGLIEASGAGTNWTIGFFRLTNTGTITAKDGATVRLEPQDRFLSIDPANGRLSTGTYLITGNSSLRGKGLNVRDNRATIELSGPASVLTDLNNVNALDTLSLNMGAVRVLAGKQLATSSGLSNGGSITIGGGSRWTLPSITQTGGSLLVNGELAASGGVLLSGGTLMGGGEVFGALTNRSIVAPGESVGTLTVDSLIQESAGQLRMELGSYGPGGGDTLVMRTGGSLGGTLHVDLVGGFLPGPESEFELLTFGSAYTGRFDSLELPSIGRPWVVRYEARRIVLVSVPEPSTLAACIPMCLLMLCRRRATNRGIGLDCTRR